ncbi:hypothetical protein ACTC6J_005433, partial [Escherichia coli]
LLYQSDNFTTPSSFLPSSTVRLLRNPTALTACSSPPQCDFDGLTFHPIKSKALTSFSRSA